MWHEVCRSNANYNRLKKCKMQDLNLFVARRSGILWWDEIGSSESHLYIEV